MHKSNIKNIAPERYRKAAYSPAVLLVPVLLCAVISGPVHALDTAPVSQDNRPAPVFNDITYPAHNRISIHDTIRQLKDIHIPDGRSVYSNTRPEFATRPGKIEPLFLWWIAGLVVISIILFVFLGPGLAGRILGSLISALSIFWLIVFTFVKAVVPHVLFNTYEGIIALITIIAGIFLSWCRKDLAAGILFILTSIGIAFFTDTYMKPQVWLEWGTPYLVAGAFLLISGLKMRIKQGSK
jgi:hypothetical protein